LSSAEDAYRQYRDRIYRFLRVRLPPHGDAEDLTQRVFLDALEALEKEAAPPASMLGWLYAVARRRLIDEIRRGSRSASPPTAGLSAAAPSYGLEVAAAVRSALAALPEGQRQVVAMRLLRGLPFAEIADALQISEPAAKMRFRRGLESVRRSLIEAGLADGSDDE
jgi:RNA polymerase sigma-70 factor (ECF subfamily)